MTKRELIKLLAHVPDERPLHFSIDYAEGSDPIYIKAVWDNPTTGTFIDLSTDPGKEVPCTPMGRAHHDQQPTNKEIS